VFSGSTNMSRPSVKMMGNISKPYQPIMQLRVNDYTYEPLETVKNQQEDMPFDETTGHNFKAVLRNIISCTGSAATLTAVQSTTTQTSTPDTTLMESSSDDDTTHYGDDEDDWTVDTSKCTDGTDGNINDEAEMIPMDEEPIHSSKKSSKALRRQKLLAKSKALDRQSKEEPGMDEWLLDAVFSPKATEKALEVADFLQQGAEATSNKAKELLKDGIQQLEQEEAAISNNGILVYGEDVDEDSIETGKEAYQSIADAATGSNLNQEEEKETTLNEDHQDTANTMNGNTTTTTTATTMFAET